IFARPPSGYRVTRLGGWFASDRHGIFTFAQSSSCSEDFPRFTARRDHISLATLGPLLTWRCDVFGQDERGEDLVRSIPVKCCDAQLVDERDRARFRFLLEHQHVPFFEALHEPRTL